MNWLAGLEGVISVPPDPLTILHKPVPTSGVFPLKIVVVIPHRVWSSPASDVVGAAYTVIEFASATPMLAPLLYVKSVSL